MSKDLKPVGGAKTWAEDEESSDEEMLLHEEEEEEGDEEEDEEEDDEDELEIHDLNISLKSSMEAKPQQKSKPYNLSKKERKELQKKEIDELDSILSEFGNPVASAAAIVTTSTRVEELKDPHDQSCVASTDKRKKKKKPSSKPLIGEDANVEVQVEDSSTVVVDVTAVLKNKLKKSNKKANHVPIAVQEALKATVVTTESKSKKKEMLKAKKQSYNEFSI